MTNVLESVYDSLPEIHGRLSMQQFYSACLPLRVAKDKEIERLKAEMAIRPGARFARSRCDCCDLPFEVARLQAIVDKPQT